MFGLSLLQLHLQPFAGEYGGTQTLFLQSQGGALLQQLAMLAQKSFKPVVIVVNKWDLAHGVTQREYEEALRSFKLWYTEPTPAGLVGEGQVAFDTEKQF